MDNTPESSSKSRKPRGEGIPRRCWSPNEELHLANVLDGMIISGWRGADGSWKNGKLKYIERAMRLKFPNCEIRGDPHVKNKLIAWKRQHGHIKDLISDSGNFRMNPLTWQIEVENPQLWADRIQINPEYATYRRKSFPLWKQWKIIFGNDRATGVSEADFGNFVSDNASRNDPPSVRNNGEFHVNVQDSNDENEGVDVNASMGKSRQRKKRKSEGSVHNTLDFEVVVNAFTTMNEQNERAIQEMKLMWLVAPPSDASIKRQNLLESLGKIPGIDVPLKFRIAAYLAKNEGMMDLFYACKLEEETDEFIKLILKDI